MSLRKILSVLLAAGTLCLPLSGCGVKSASAEFFAMDTLMSVTAYGARAEEAVAAAEAEINALEASLSVTRADSEIAALNASGSGEVGDETAEVLRDALSLSAETGGAFDITVSPIVAAWGFYTDDYRVPAASEIAALLPLVDYRTVSVDGNRVTLGAGQQVDLGGIAKGYAARRLTALFGEYGVESALLSLGGSVQTVGVKPDGSLWRTGIRNPDGSDNYLGVVTSAGAAIVTSGAYERYFEQDGVRYHHIIDPATGYPAESGLASVTIVCDDPVQADAFSTALFVMGADGAAAFWRERTADFDMVLYTDAGDLLITAGLASEFSSDFDFEVISP